MVLPFGIPPSGGREARLTVRSLAADVTLTQSSSTLQDVAGLYVTLRPDSRYRFWLYLLFNSGATPDFKVAFTALSGATGGYTFGGSLAVPPSGNSETGLGTTTALDGGASDVLTILVGRVTTASVGGDFYVRAAQNTGDASDTKVLAGTWLEVLKTS